MTTSRTGPRGPYAKSAERRRAIVDAAVDVFAAKGYAGGTIREIADRAGIGQSSVLHYYPTKRALLDATMTRRDEHRYVWPGAGQEPFPDRVLAQAVANEDIPTLIQLYSLLTAEAATDEHPGRDYVATRFTALRGDYAAEFRALDRAGRLRAGVDPDEAAAMLIALWDGIQLQWLHDPARVDVPATLAAFFRLVLPDGDGPGSPAGLRAARGR